MKLSTFYGGMIGLVVIGGGAMWYASRTSTSAAATPAVITDPADTIVFPGYSMGSPNAPVEVIEYGDFVCPICGNFAVITEPDVRERLVQTGQIRWVYRDRPLDIPGHQNAPLAHLAAACAADQNKFWEMHDQMYFNQAAWGEESGAARKLRGYAEAIHLNMDQYNACVDGKKYAARIARSADAAHKLGIEGTPTFVINGHQLPGGTMPYDKFRATIDSIAKLSAPAAAPAKSAPTKGPAKAPAKAQTKS